MFIYVEFEIKTFYSRLKWNFAMCSVLNLSTKNSLFIVKIDN